MEIARALPPDGAPVSDALHRDCIAWSAEENLIASRVSRRAFVGATAGATLAALVGREPRLVHAQGRPTADAIIVLWMAGGMAQTETFDPKRYTPFAPGVRTERVLSTFPSIDTAVDHIKIEMRRPNHMSLSRVAANGAPRHPNAAAALGTPPRRARRREP